MTSPPTPSRWLICFLLLLATTLNYLDRVALTQLAVEMKSELNFDDIGYGQLESAFAIAFGLGTLLTGWLVDRVNVRWVYPAVVFGWSLAGFLTGYVGEFSMLLACRVMLGLFEAGNWPCGIRVNRTILSPEERSFGNALFQSGTAIGAILAPQIILLCYDHFGADTPGVWRMPFRIIGLLGLGWIVLWLIAAPGRLFPPPQRALRDAVPFWHVFHDRRFWVLVLVIIGVNTSWHTVRAWMPMLLQENHRLDKIQFQRFSTWYYVSADIGSWFIGLATIALARRHDLFKVRLALFVACTVLLVLSTSLLASRGSMQSDESLFTVKFALIVTGFAALGLFPTYFALSQDLSAAHQGKITGTLGAINAFYLAGMYAVQSRIVNETKAYALMMALGSIPAVVASTALFRFWLPRGDLQYLRRRQP